MEASVVCLVLITMATKVVQASPDHHGLGSSTYGAPPPPPPPGPFYAVAVISAGGTGAVLGTLLLYQQNPQAPVAITGAISGLFPNGSLGFHVHTYGDLSSGCASTGTHYTLSPPGEVQQTHGGPDAAVRHTGDLGNIHVDASGVSNVAVLDSKISLGPSPTSIIGRAIVIHSGTDDLGLGGVDSSKTTGNAGGRFACGVIGIKAAPAK